MGKTNSGFQDVAGHRLPPTDGPTKNELLVDGEFNVGVISLDGGQEIEPHPEAYAVFFYVLEGTGVFSTGDGTLELTAGDGLYLDPGERRGIRCLDPLTILGIRVGVEND